jgi:hypothetical protein
MGWQIMVTLYSTVGGFPCCFFLQDFALKKLTPVFKYGVLHIAPGI